MNNVAKVFTISIFVKQHIEQHFCLKSIIVQCTFSCLKEEELIFIPEYHLQRDSGHWSIFTICLLLSKLFCLRKGILDFVMWHAPEFSMCCHSYSLNKLCWKGHCWPTDLCKSRNNPVAAGIVQEENKQEGGRRQWEEESGKLLGGRAGHRVSQHFCITADRGQWQCCLGHCSQWWGSVPTPGPV